VLLFVSFVFFVVEINAIATCGEWDALGEPPWRSSELLRTIVTITDVSAASCRRYDKTAT